jgi:hypothetical protein
MKKLFLVFAKLLGLYQLYTAVMGAMQLTAMVSMSRIDGTPLTHLALGVAGLLLFVAVSLAIARILIVKTDWLAEKVGIRDDAPVEGLEHVPALAVGICLIGIFVTVQAVPHVARLLLTYRNIWANASRDILWPQMVPSVLQLTLGLFLALQPGRVAGLVARAPRP